MGMVGSKVAALSASPVGGPASTLRAAETGRRRETATAAAAETMLRKINIHAERLSVE
jgi:hypothetical protein